MALFPWRDRLRLDEDDFKAEIESHLAIAVRERIADGADEQEARRAALKEFGNLALTTDEARRVWSPRWFEAVMDLLRDSRYALRLLLKSPGFSLIAIVVLAFGISLNTAVFSLFKALALEPLAGVQDSRSLAVVMARTNADRDVGLSYPDYQYLREHDRAFAGFAGSVMSGLNVGRGRRSERVLAEFVTGDYFKTLGVRAQLGRTLSAADEVAPGAHPVAVLSNRLWRRTFGADPGIVGRTVHFNRQPLTVVGVADPAFHGTIVSFEIDVFVPLMMAKQFGLSFQAASGDPLADRGSRLLMVLGRRVPNISVAAASEQLTRLGAGLAAEAPLDDVRERFRMVPIWQSPYGAQTYMLPAVIVLGVMGAVLLLIVCANIAGLVLVRGVARRGELALRLALGAGRRRILRLLFIENLMLAAPGAGLGLLLVLVIGPRLATEITTSAPVGIFLNTTTDRLVLAFAAVVSCVTAIGFGFLPALRTSRIDLLTVIKDNLSPRGAARGRFRTALVVAQVAASFFLLVGAALVQRSLDAARRADGGFDARQVVSLTVDLHANGYDEARGRVFYSQLVDDIKTSPGVESATLAIWYPMMMIEPGGDSLAVEGQEPQPHEDLTTFSNVVAPDYFQTLRIPLEAGREFARRDDEWAEAVAIVNRTLADRFWGSPSSALGQRLRLGSGEWRTVIGVARDVKYARINERPRAYVYTPFLQAYRHGMMLHVRGSGNEGALLQTVRDHLQALDPDLPVLEAKTLSEQTTAALTIFQITARALAIFGSMAMALAAMGLYGLVSYSVKQSTHEIGIRMALGAQRSDVLRRFLGRGLRLGATGVACGLVASLGVTGLLANVLYEVSAVDPLSFGGASIVVLGSVAIASLIPAWRATRTNPLVALRHH